MQFRWSCGLANLAARRFFVCKLKRVASLKKRTLDTVVMQAKAGCPPLHNAGKRPLVGPCLEGIAVVLFYFEFEILSIVCRCWQCKRFTRYYCRAVPSHESQTEFDTRTVAES